LFDDLAQRLRENNYPVPLGLFLALARGLVAPRFGRGDAKIRNRPAVLRVSDFRVFAEIPDQDALIYAASHYAASDFAP
jgi:hypothetical protein